MREQELLASGQKLTETGNLVDNVSQKRVDPFFACTRTRTTG